MLPCPHTPVLEQEHELKSRTIKVKSITLYGKVASGLEVFAKAMFVSFHLQPTIRPMFKSKVCTINGMRISID